MTESERIRARPGGLDDDPMAHAFWRSSYASKAVTLASSASILSSASPRALTAFMKITS